MQTATDRTSERVFIRRAVEAAIRIGMLLLLAAWCFQIVSPFIVPLAWGVIIAVAIYPVFAWLSALLGGRDVIAAILVTILLLILLLWPTVMLATTLVDGAQAVAQRIADGRIVVPAPPPSVAQWPVVGDEIATFWLRASQNLAEVMEELRPQISAFSRWLLKIAAETGLGILIFIAGIIIAGVLLPHASSGGGAARAIAARLSGTGGSIYADVGQATVRSVARGILGVALIQSLLAGLGFLAAGVPAAGLLAMLCLLLAVVQIGPGIVLIGAVIYVFAQGDTVVAIIFLVWSVFVGLLDNVLKPLLLGRGVKVPMAVIFIGAIGGLLTAGIIGLFVGAVVLAVSYTLFVAWLNERDRPAVTAPEEDQSPAA